MDKILTYLKQLDLSDIEAKLYLTLLRTGPLSVRELAETTEIKRTTAYLYIDQLVEKGLLMKLVKASRKLVAANELDSLNLLVEKKVESAMSIQQNFPDILEILTTSLPQEKDAGDAEIIYYKGKNGVKKIYEEALQAEVLFSYVNIADMEDMFPQNIMSFDSAFQKNKNLILREIIEDSPASRNQAKLLTKNERYKFKFLPNDVKISASDILIYDGKVAIINVRDKITGIILHNRDYYNISKELFDFMWRFLPSPK